MEILKRISEAVQHGKAYEVKTLVKEAANMGVSSTQIMNNGLLTGMGIIGDKFKNNVAFVPEVLVASRAIRVGMQTLKELFLSNEHKTKGLAVIGTVKGDLHDIGKNLVVMMLEDKGFEVCDLGTDVSAEEFVEAAILHDAQFICCSALLSTTMNEMKKVIETAIRLCVRDRFIIVVGGAPVTASFAESIGADIYTNDAASAADAIIASADRLRRI